MKKRNLSENEKNYLSTYPIPDSLKQEAVTLTFEKGELLSRQGEFFPYLFFLTKGKVKVCITEANGKNLLLRFYYAGSMLGSVELFLKGHATTTVTAITAVTGIGLPMNACIRQSTLDTPFVHFIAQSMAITFDKSSKRNAANMLYPSEVRLCAYIEATNENGRFEENLTEIADLLGVSYRHLLRNISLLCTLGILKKMSRTAYRIQDPKALRDMASDCYLIYE
ncbi:MAG: family transcriptional regulator, putative post-exponential-phase nitrogen-starvation [Clostridiales bacterium]|nr:family transcriptional regulator, putative post-exponential-phase nitrogen-starvation [Clostridiales bacterium]